jgi:hypothetical protein
MKPKIRVDKVKRRVENSDSEIEKLNQKRIQIQKQLEEKEQRLALTRTLSHPGEATYQMLVLHQITNQLLERIAMAEEKRNELMQENSEEFEEEGSNEVPEIEDPEDEEESEEEEEESEEEEDE